MYVVKERRKPYRHFVVSDNDPEYETVYAECKFKSFAKMIVDALNFQEEAETAALTAR